MRMSRPAGGPYILKDDRQSNESPLDALQRQLQEMLQNGNLGIASGDKSASVPPEDDPPEDYREALERIRHFDRKPREIRDYLDRFVIKQDEAKRALAVAICDHYNHVRRCTQDPVVQERDYVKQNIVLLGPTGVGKTYLMRCLARLIGVPFVKADATKFSETGYVGYDVEDLVRDLVKNANGNTDLAEYGIIFIDEIDKIAGSTREGGSHRDVSGRGVQINLLKLMEETEVNPLSQTDMLGQMQAMFDMQRGGSGPRRRTINTRHILFIVSGAFDRMPELVRRRISKARIGFGSDAPSGNDAEDSRLLKKVSTDDFIRFGFEPEFIGRLPVRIACEALTAADLEAIMLQAENSILHQYRDDFRGYGIDLRVTPEAIREIARRAKEEKTGARGLMTVMEKILRNFKFELPSTTIESFEVTTDVVDDPGRCLVDMLAQNTSGRRQRLETELTAFRKAFQRETGLLLTIQKPAAEWLIEECLRRDKTMRSFCEQHFRHCIHGFKLIARNSGRTRFTLTRAFVEQPEAEMSAWIQASFSDSDVDQPPQPTATSPDPTDGKPGRKTEG